MKFDAESKDPSVCSKGIVMDATDRYIQYPISGDTHTGWVICIKEKIEENEKGNMIISFVRVRRRYLAPLYIIPKEETDDETWKKGLAVHLEELPHED